MDFPYSDIDQLAPDYLTFATAKMLPVVRGRKYLCSAEVEFPSDVDAMSIKFLQILESYPGELESMPGFLPRFANLEYLSLPAKLASLLTNDIVPPNLRALYVYNGEFGFHPELRLNSLIFLYTGDTAPRFTPENLPSLQDLNIRLKGAAVLKNIAQLKQLRFVAVSPFKVELFEALRGSSIRGLSLHKSKITSFEGIEHLQTLEYLRLADFSSLSSLEHWAELPNLKELFIQSCKHLPDLSVLLRMPALEKVDFIDCGPLDWGGVRDQVQARLKHLDDTWT